jgi:hypothetical protein
MNNKEIGIAYLYNPQIHDYSIYFINQKLKAFVKLYFNYFYLNSTNNRKRDGNYILINPELMIACKIYYNYQTIEKKLNGNTKSQQIINDFPNNDLNIKDILNDRTILKLIKYNFLDINQHFFQINNFINNNSVYEDPKIEKLEGNDYYYYKNFELINEDIYKILFNSIDYQKKGNYKTCYFENNYMYFTLPGNFCGKKIPRNIEICKFNKDDNLFQASFLVECNKNDSFKSFLVNAKQIGGLDIFLDSFKFNNNIEQIYDNFNQPIGLIYNLIFSNPHSKKEEFQQTNRYNIIKDEYQQSNPYIPKEEETEQVNLYNDEIKNEIQQFNPYNN